VPSSIESNPAAADCPTQTLIVTGADRTHFANSKMLVASWWRHNRELPFCYCDYGLSEDQKREVSRWPVRLLETPAEFAGAGGWRCKAGLIRYLKFCGSAWKNAIWIDADALFLQPLPDVNALMEGYDLLIDAHRQSVGEIVERVNLDLLPLDPGDAYFSSGFWITSSESFLALWDELVERVCGRGNLWENDAFVAAVYSARCRVRTVCGNIWHSRGATSLNTCALKEGELRFADAPVRILHANDGYTVRADGRRVFNRPELKCVQDLYEEEFERIRRCWESGPEAPRDEGPHSTSRLVATVTRAHLPKTPNGVIQAKPGPANSSSQAGAASRRHLHALYNGHWAGNLGDSAVFEVFERNLPDGARLTAEVHTAGNWSHRHNTQLIQYQDRAECDRALIDAHAAIFLGTTIVTDLHDGRWPIESVIRGLRRAKAAGKSVCAAAVGIYPGPWADQRRQMARELIPRVDLFIVRDGASQEALLENDADPARIIQAADLAWLLDCQSANGVVATNVAQCSTRPCVAVNVVHEDWRHCDEFYRSLAADFDAFSEESGCAIVFFCNEVRDGEYYDAFAARRVAEMMKTGAILPEVKWIAPKTMVNQLRACQLAVSMRYHFSVFSALAGTPWVGFRRGAKLDSLLAEFNLSPVAEMGEPVNGRLYAALRAVWSSRGFRAEEQRTTVEALQERARTGLRAARQWMDHVDPVQSRTAPGAAPSTTRRYDPPVTGILVTRLDGLGDIVLGTSLLAGLHKQWPDARITLLVRPKHVSVAEILPDWVKVVTLPFDPRDPLDRPVSAIAEELTQFSDRHSPDICIQGEYNRVWASEIVTALVSAERGVSFDGPSGLNMMYDGLLNALSIERSTIGVQVVHAESTMPETVKYATALTALGVSQHPLPEIKVSPVARERAATVWNQLSLKPSETVVCFPGSGDGLDKSMEPDAWRTVIWQIADLHNRPVLLLGGSTDDASLQAVAALGLPRSARTFQVPDGDFGLLAALLEGCATYVGADTGPMHIAAVLGRPTLGIFGGGHWPRFRPVGPRTLVLRMPLGCFGCQWLCPFEKRHCIKDIPLSAVRAAVDRILSGAVQHDFLAPEVIDAPAPDLAQGLMHAAMRGHTALLELNHRVAELLNSMPGNEIVSRTHRHQSTPSLPDRVHKHELIFSEMTRHNQKRDEAIAKINETLAEMTRHNEARDRAIAELSRQLDDLRRRSVRLPSFVYRIWRRLTRQTLHLEA
jgi:ADP-heptose:LPS heptosyltransferase/polysaccharide pyruvyl transferase WcaK-like protein